MNGKSETSEKSHDSSAISIDTKDLSSKKVIQVRIDNPFLSNDDSEEEDFENNPFCIKVSKGSEECQTTLPLTNGDKISSNHGDGDNSNNGGVTTDQTSLPCKAEGENSTESVKKVEVPPDEKSGTSTQACTRSENIEESTNEKCDNAEDGDSAQNGESNEGNSEMREQREDAMADEDNSQCSSISEKSSLKSENNFGDVEDENSRGSMKFSEKLDNAEAPELSKVVESESTTNEGVTDISEAGEEKRNSDVDESKEIAEGEEMPVLERENNNRTDLNEGHIPTEAFDEKESIIDAEDAPGVSVSEKVSTESTQNDQEMTEKENKGEEVSNEKMEVDQDENNSAEKRPSESDAIKEAEDDKVKGLEAELKKSQEMEEKNEKEDKVELNTEKPSSEPNESMEIDAGKETAKEEVDKSVPVTDAALPNSVEKVQDEDGTDILITVNDDNSDEEIVEVKVESSKPDIRPVTPVKSAETSKPKVKSTFENDVVIVDLSAESPKEDRAKPSWSSTGVESVVPKTSAPTMNASTIVPKAVQNVNGTIVINGQQYIQQILYDTNGRKQIVQVPITNNNKHLYSAMLSQAALAVKTPQVQKPPPPPPKPKTGLARFKEIDDNVPIASWEQLDLVKYEWNTKKYDNTFWAGICPVNKLSELSAPAKFLSDLGSDLVKKSAYDQILKVQHRKEEEGKLGKAEKENLSKMKDIVAELKEKLKDFELDSHKCDGCNFVSESTNVMQFHKEHPHMDPPLDPHGEMLCSLTDCDFKTSNTTEFAQHMENQHRMKARVYDKPEPHKCSLCYYEAKNKPQLTKHKFKCMKQFKPSLNQVPHYTDVNYCLKNTFYKYQVKKNVPLKPKPVAPQPTLVRAPIAQPNILQHSKVPLSSGIISIPGSRPVIVSTDNIKYSCRPVFSSMGTVATQSLQLIGVAGTQPVAATTAGKPTVNELLKQKQAQNTVLKTGTSVIDLTPMANKCAFEVCEICGGYVKDKMSLRIHFFYAHKIDLPASLFSRGLPPLFCDVCRMGFWTSQGLTKHKYSLKHFSTANQTPNVVKNIVSKPTPECWICNQKPANLYSHLFKFHRLSTSQCMAQRRCMFCGIQSNTVREMEIHMAATHGVLVKGDDKNAKVKSKPPASGLVRNNFCVFCSRQFADNTQLTLHCLRDHATCSGCGMVVANAAQLQTHVCKNSTSKKCEVCGIKNLKAQYYTKHVMTHLKKCTVKLKRVTDKEIEDAMGKKRKAEMDLQKQKEMFTKLEADIWNEIESRRKRDREEEELSKDPVAQKRKSEEDKEEKIQKKIQKLEDKDPDYTPCEGNKAEEEVVVVDDDC